jgi:hypothetical protein
LAKKRSRSAAPASRYRRDQLAKRAVVNESLIATVVAPLQQPPLALKAPAAERDENE